jgi:soluble lytic murein transglycosylase-like protein
LEEEMNFGPKLIIPIAVFASLILSLGLFVMTAGATFQSIQSAPEDSPLSGVNDQADSSPVTVVASACDVSPKYPPAILKWCQLITDNAQKTALPADLIAAVILQESGGDHLAYSQSGAVGLMQIMPNDGLAESFSCSNGPCFKNRPSIDKLQDPGFNIQYGAQMLKRLTSKLGTYREALKSYGPMDMGYAYADRVLQIYAQYQK